MGPNPVKHELSHRLSRNSDRFYRVVDRVTVEDGDRVRHPIANVQTNSGVAQV